VLQHRDVHDDDDSKQAFISSFFFIKLAKIYSTRESIFDDVFSPISMLKT